MMVLHRDEQKIEHARFVDLRKFLREGDLLVLNDSRVLSARHFSDNGKLEFLFLEKLAARRWKALVKPGRRFGRGAVASIQGVQAEGGQIFADGSHEIILAEDIDLLHGGAMPLPPYIKRPALTSISLGTGSDRPSIKEDEARYQTVFAKYDGSLAAPTAGLHFTPALEAALRQRGVEINRLTLHVGAGTFLPVKVEDTAEHRMHAEWGTVSAETARKLNEARAKGGRIVAIGTTSLRLLESAAHERCDCDR